MLKRVVLTNFGGFAQFSVDFDKFTVLVGPNNGGKTTLLRAIKFVHDAMHLAATRGGNLSVSSLFADNLATDLGQTSGRISILDTSLLRYEKRLEMNTQITLNYVHDILGSFEILATIPQNGSHIVLSCPLFDVIRKDREARTDTAKAAISFLNQLQPIS
jgi:predicted ATP-dependent endonuclease of OLD family